MFDALSWGLLVLGLIFCFVHSLAIGLLTLGSFLLFYNIFSQLTGVELLDNPISLLIGMLSLLTGLILFFVSSVRHGFVALGMILFSFLIISIFERIER